jgi:ornithine cyclodeaminase/alanine dehydrogenase-like protein (mu-crystallin family)
MTILLHDEDVQKLSYADAVQVMEGFFLARAAGNTAGMPRWEFPFPEGRLTFTVGAAPESVGFRVYARGDFQVDEQLVAVWDRQTGALKGLVVGAMLGVMRTGAIGAVAIKYLTPANASTLALIGTGRQALSQIRAIATIRPLTEIRVFSRNAENRQQFCKEAQSYLPNITIQPAESAETAVHGAEIVIAATSSKTPVIHGEWLEPNAHVSTLGTKGRNVREVDEDLVNRAAFIISDTPEQSRNYPDGTILDGTTQALFDLSDLLAERLQRPEGISLFISSGLAGTEVALASYLIRKFNEKAKF